MANTQMQAVMQQVNDLELKYRDKQESFWQRMFMGCTGFVAVVTPLSLQVSMPKGARICLAIAVAATALCALFMVPLLYSSVRWHKGLFNYGLRVARGMSEKMDFSPIDTTRLERCCNVLSMCLFVVAIGCLVCACFCT